MLKSANLPKSKVSAVLYCERYKNKLSAPLSALGIKSITVPEYNILDNSVSGHIDLFCTYIGKSRFIVPESTKNTFETALADTYATIYTGKDLKDSNYPNDIAYNVAVVGKRAFCNKKATEGKLKEFLINDGLDLIDCRQGYAKCSICVVDENSIITADRGIMEKAKAVGMDVLLIESGGIDLPGYDYGFIGGATVKLNKNLLAFTGTIEHLINANEIKEFLKNKNIEPIYLTNEIIFDVGSIIPII